MHMQAQYGICGYRIISSGILLFADASSSVKKLLVISHLSLFIFKTGIRNFPENSELIF